MCETARNNSQEDDPVDVYLSSSADKVYKMVGESIGKRAAAKSCGLFRADDWQCGHCRNVNWARRSLCNVCNAPKFVEIEQRTGVGGGFNEREEIVEYVKRGDGDDDEYDEYGRRRRTKWRKDEDVDVVQEESEDEDMDLSKYDLASIEGCDRAEVKRKVREND